MLEGPLGARASRVQLARENERLRHELLALRRFIDSMHDLCEAAGEPRPHEEIMDLLEAVLSQARRAVNAKDGSLLVPDEETDELVFVIAQGDIPRERLMWRRIPPRQGIAGWVARERRATVVNDAPSDDRFWSRLDDELGFTTTSVLAAPIIGGGRVLGVIELLNKLDGLPFNNEDQGLLALVCRFAGEVLYNTVHHAGGAVAAGAR